MAGKGKRKAVGQPISSTQATKRQKHSVRSSPVSKIPTRADKSRATGSQLDKTSNTPAKTELADNHICVAVTKAINESKQLKKCKGEARKDLCSNIVDLLTEALVKDVNAANLKGDPANVSLSARDEPIPVDDAPQKNPKLSQVHSQKRLKKTTALAPSKSIPPSSKQKGKHSQKAVLEPEKRQSRKQLGTPKLSEKARPKAPPKKEKPKSDAQSIMNVSGKPKKKSTKRTATESPISRLPKNGKQPPTETILFIEESIVDGGAAMKSEPRSFSVTKTRRQKSVDGYDTEVVLDSSDHDLNPSQSKSKDLILNTRSRLPWWRTTESLVSLPSSPANAEDLLKFYVMAVIRSCVRGSWSGDALKQCFDKDPSSSRGKAFLAVSSSLLLMERARHMGQCHVKWRPELIRELVQRRVIEWSRIQKHVSFDHFAGCDVCLGHREATIRLWLRGDRYDSSDFWPGSSRVDVLTAEERDDGVLSVAVELQRGTKNERYVRIGGPNEKGDSEFWVDPQCLRKCLLFHELVHATAIIARDLRILIEDELRNGVVHLDMRNRVPGDEKLGVSERLERYLVQAVSENRDFLKRRTKHLMEIIRLGDIYFSAVEEELIDSGNPERRASRRTPQIYDPPIVLNDEKYKDRIERIVSLTQQRGLTASFATFG